MNNDAFLELRGIGKHFRTGAARQHVVKAVDGVSFSVGRARRLASWVNPGAARPPSDAASSN